MKKIYTGIDFGSDSIKVLVCEVINHKFHVLASSSVRSIGIKEGKIVEKEMAAKSLQLVLHEIEETSGFSITKALVNVPLEDAETEVMNGSVSVEDTITGEDIVRVLQDAILGQISGTREVVSILPVVFQLDEKEKILDPRGMQGKKLSVKAAVTTIPKANSKIVYDVLKKASLEPVDIAFDIDGDYYEAKNSAIDRKMGAMINIGKDKTTIALYNKGIMIKHAVLPIGSDHVDRDIARIYGLDLGDARGLKESFAVATETYADKEDMEQMESIKKESVTIYQKELAQIVEARLKQILKLSKKQINLLTNREISYIIVTGGISEMVGFPYLVEEILGKNALTLSMTTMGARHNKYSSVLGMLRYFDRKLELRDIEYSMLEDSNEMDTTKRKPSSAEDSILNKMFGRFFGN